jgi:hypothetical protein
MINRYQLPYAIEVRAFPISASLKTTIHATNYALISENYKTPNLLIKRRILTNKFEHFVKQIDTA